MCSYKKEVERCEHRKGKDTQEDHVSMEAGLGEKNERKSQKLAAP